MTETVVGLVVWATTMAVLTGMSLYANRRFQAEPRLPMQWWLDGQVTWTAPRTVALAFTPVLAAVCLGAMVALIAFGRTKPGEEHLVVPVNILGGLVFLGIHGLHLWLMRLTIQRQRERSF